MSTPANNEKPYYAAELTTTAGSWLAAPPDPAEIARIAAARRELSRHRNEAQKLGADQIMLNALSLQIFQHSRFAPLHFADWVVETMLRANGEPPVVEDPRDSSFGDYLHNAVVGFASARVRRAMAEQVRRYLPDYIDAGLTHEALVIEHNAYMTVMSDAATPLLVQMTVSAMARWYEEHEEEDEAESGE